MAWMSRRNGADEVRRGFDTRRPAVRRWVTSLPLGDLDETGRRLALTLREVIGRARPRNELQHYLEATGPAVALALDHLASRLLPQRVPFAREANRAAPLAMEIAGGYVRAFGRLLRSGGSSRWPWERWLERRRQATALHRIFHYSERLLWLHRSLHREPPPGFWRRLHRCYDLAQQRRLCPMRCGSPDGNSAATTVAEAYHRLLLVALLPATLTPSWQARIRAGLDGWAALVKLERPGKAVGALRHAVDLDGDSGAMRLTVGMAGDATDGLRALHTTALGARLTAFDGDGDDPGLLAMLHDCWCGGRERSEARRKERLRAEVLVGLDALFACAGGRVETQPARFTRGGELAQVIDEACGGRAPREGPPPMSGDLLDRSDSGALLALHDVVPESVAPGMALGVRVEGGNWRVGVITRVRRRERMTELGVRFHLSGLLPARLCAAGTGEKGTWLRAVLGRSERGWALAGPALAAVRHGEALLEVAGRVVRVRRERSVCLSGYTEIFAFRAAGGEPLVRAPVPVPTPAVPEPAMAKKPGAPDRESRIRELMARTGFPRDDAAFLADAELAST